MSFPVTIQGARTAADWTSANPVLPQFEIGIEIDPATGAWGRFKIGDGRTAWTLLPYQSTPGVGATQSEIDQFNDVSAYQETIILAGALTPTKKYSALEIPTGGAVTLAVPPASMLGQIKVIEMTVDDGDVTLALTNVIGQSSGTTATFNTAGDQLVLIAAAAKWIVLKEQGIALS